MESLKPNIFSKTRNSFPFEYLKPSEFNYQLSGSNDSLLIVLIHGLKSALQTFFPIIDALNKNYQVLIYDQRGHGQSPITNFDYSLDSMANDLNNLLIFLGLNKKKFVLLGHSAGGRTSMRYCELFPENVKALIIEDMEFIPRKNDGLVSAKKKAEQLKKLPEVFENIEKFNNLMGKQMGKDELEEILLRRVLKKEDGSIVMLYKPWVACLYAHFYQNKDFTVLCKNIEKPTLIIQAEPLNSAISSKGLKNIENCRNKLVEIKRIPGAGHNVHGTKTTEFLKILEIFLKKL